MPAISLETMQRILPREKQQSIIDSVFGPEEQTPSASEQAAAVRDQRFQDWLNSRKQAVEQQRTDATKMARFNALGNVLTTMVQPLGWAVGGSTAGVQPVDNRQYLDAFNRAVKASDDLRNIGTLEGEYQFKLADENYRRQLALEDEQRKQAQALDAYEQRANLDLEKQKQLYGLRSQLSQQQMEERIKVAEATAKAKYQFRTSGGGKITESVRDNLLKRANSAYAQLLSDYYKKKGVGIENLQEPPSYDQFLAKFASDNGYNVSETSGGTQASGSTTGSKPAGKKGGFQTGNTSTAASSAPAGKKGGFVR